MESVMVSGVTATKDEAKITLHGIADTAGHAGEGVQAAGGRRHRRRRDRPGLHPGRAHQPDVHAAAPPIWRARSDILRQAVREHLLPADQIKTETNLSKVSVVGVGMRSHAGVALKMFEILARENIHVHLISTSEIKISCVIEAKYAELAVRALHDGFELGKK